ncbi:MAG: type II/IV secretion system protein [bacterium]|nr:type II/IV secretion system protein [bacterium]
MAANYNPGSDIASGGAQPHPDSSTPPISGDTPRITPPTSIQAQAGNGNTVQSIHPDSHEGIPNPRDRAIQDMAIAIIEKAIAIEASDIHINPEKDRTRLRYRRDGVLHEQEPLDRAKFAPLASCLKIMASLDIAQRWIPQDGRIRLEYGDRHIELRVSTYPTIDGESIVMRILDKDTTLPDTGDLGLSERDMREFNKVINRSGGIFLVTGPTGSGKTTTLYSAINSLDSHHKHIVTIEEPVECELKDINQGEIKEKRGFGFAQALRALLRHDPDIILVGEIRDGETAETAFRAANTGHLVLSTLHTNSAVSAVTRLKDLGVESFLVGSSLLASLGQRLVRKICPDCIQEVQPRQRDLESVEHLGVKATDTFFAGKGCTKCHNTGYKGRIGIFELFALDDEMRDMISHNLAEKDLLEYARRGGMTTLLEDGLTKARAGLTSLLEVARVL